ncbi:MAG: hypothetical protein CMK07_11860 [Ponticaulis sp.]|nr:hypothetical protein [Ponticaulis sp.]
MTESKPMKNNMHEAETEDSAEDMRDRRSRQKRIGNQLRRLYDNVATEPVPDDFLKLLEEADKKKQS